jgi:cytochrome c oxidase subunit 3
MKNLERKIGALAADLKPLTPAQITLSQHKSREALMWIGIVSMIMFFAGLTSAYVVRRGEGGSWINIDLPYLFYYSTAFILIGSVTFSYGYNQLKAGQLKAFKLAVLATLVLGILFTLMQFKAYGYLVQHGLYLASKNPASSFLYIITAAHLAHLLGGILMLALILFKALRNKYSATEHHGIYVASIFWHFLGVLWLLLFLFLIFFR